MQNKDLILYVLTLIAFRTLASSSNPSSPANVTFEKVKGHSGIDGNVQADRLANLGASKPYPGEDDYDLLRGQLVQSAEQQDLEHKLSMMVDEGTMPIEVRF